MDAIQKPGRQMIYSGTSGLVLPVPNKRLFPEAFQNKSRLSYYSSLFNSIEINSSFKKLPMPRTVEKWAASVPDAFQFTFKVSRAITHNKGLAFNPDDIHRFLQIVNFVGAKKGCLLIQFPGKLSVAQAGQLEDLLKVILQADAADEWKIALEFRNTSWYHDNVYDLLHQHNMSLVLHDMPSSAPPLKEMKQAFVYIRLHGPEKGYRGSYSNEFLFPFSKQIRTYKEEGKPVYVYFNNTLGDAVNNLITLNQFLKST